MARNYRRITSAETHLLTVKGVLDEVDTKVPASAWFALGYIKGHVEDALASLAGAPSGASVDAYTTGADAMRGYVQVALFGEGSDGGE